MDSRTLPPQLVRELLLAQGDRFFRVTFIKRSDGQLRTMLARRGVVPKNVRGPSSGKKGAVTRFEEDINNNTLTVFEVGHGYKRIPLDGVLEIAAANAITKA